MLTFAVSTKNRERLLDGDIAEAFLPSGAQAGRRAKCALGRALYSGWTAAGSLGEREEFPAKRWQACGLLNQAADGNGHRLVLSSNPEARSACGVGFTVKWLISACCHFRIPRPTKEGLLAATLLLLFSASTPQALSVAGYYARHRSSEATWD